MLFRSVEPARGQYTTNGQLGSPSQQSVIQKYYPFLIENLTFRTVANAIEYQVVGKPVPYATGASQARGTIPFAYALAGTTVSQILLGGGGPTITTTNQAEPGARQTQKTPNTQKTPVLVKDLPMKQQAAIAAGTDPNTVNDQGMAFGGGGL